MYRVDDSLFFQLFAVQYCDDDNEIEFLEVAHASAKLDWEEGAGAALAPKAEPTVWIDSNPDYYDVISVDPVLTDDVIEQGLLSWVQLAEVFNQTD